MLSSGTRTRRSHGCTISPPQDGDEFSDCVDDVADSPDMGLDAGAGGVVGAEAEAAIAAEASEAAAEAAGAAKEAKEILRSGVVMFFPDICTAAHSTARLREMQPAFTPRAHLAHTSHTS